MKFTEGYWLMREDVQASFASQAFTIEEIPNGMRITASERPVHSRADSLDISVVYIDFVSAGHNDIEVTTTHFEGYDSKEPRFDLERNPDETSVEITDEKAVMSAGDIKVIVTRDPFSFYFEAKGKRLTGAGYHNFGYMRTAKEPTTYGMGKEYFKQNYVPYINNELSVKPGETIYGFGEKFTPFVKNGQTVNMWNEDGGTASNISYKNIPFYMSSENYGVFVDCAGQVSFEVCSEKVEYVGFSAPGEQLRFHLFYGETPAEIISRYTELTGRPALPPAWSFGLWLSTSFKPSYDEETTNGLIEGMRDRNIPFRVFHFDCYWMRAFHWCDFVWDPAVFSDVKGMIKRYHDKGLKLCCWINPYVAQNTDAFREGAKEGLFLMREDGRGIKQVDNWQPGMAVIDFTNPRAVDWFSRKVADLLSAGIDSIKTDFGERIPTDVKYFDNSDPEMMHNYYTYLYNKTVFETIEKERGKGEAVLFSRSATAGSQKFPIHWGGDCEASYASMAESIHAGLSFCMSGFSFWSHDISGFEKTATPDLYKRWAQFGLFSTHSRLHGSDSYRVPWLFDDESNDVVRFFSKLKCSLMPYYYALAVESHQTGIPSMRPMPFEFPGDRACQYLDLQYMMGDALLVAPIVNDKSIGEFYLPDGKWIGLIDNEILEGGRWYKKEYDYMNLPVFVKADKLIAVGSHTDVPDYEYSEGTTLRLYLPIEGKAAECRIPDLAGNISANIKALLENGVVSFDVAGKLSGAKYEIYLEDGRKLTGDIEGAHTEVRI